MSTIKKFHKYLYGKYFTIYTDHKPLVGIFGKTGKNSIYVTRLQRFILDLSKYEFDIIYRPSNKLSNADFCSRFPLQQEVQEDLGDGVVKSINFSKDLPLAQMKLLKRLQKTTFCRESYFTCATAGHKEWTKALSMFMQTSRTWRL